MKKGMRILETIEDYFDELRKIKAIAGEKLLDNGKIYYMNGNDGTGFDWDMNDRVCEFMVFYNSGWGYIKVFIYKDGSMVGYIYENSAGCGEKARGKRMSQDDARFLANLLIQEADRKDKYDVSISEIDFDLNGNEVAESLYDCYDEDDDEDYDDEDYDDWN